MIGTTDRKFDDNPDTARADAAEVTYLLGEVNALIPQTRLTEAFNMHNDETTEALVWAAEKSDAPVVLQVGRAGTPAGRSRRHSAHGCGACLRDDPPHRGTVRCPVCDPP
ncbi:MAG: hypothetical protein INF52_03315 [Rhodobacter sp.]|nr:hypothetical protein [Rhodobacter sp.]